MDILKFHVESWKKQWKADDDNMVIENYGADSEAVVAKAPQSCAVSEEVTSSVTTEAIRAVLPTVTAVEVEGSIVEDAAQISEPVEQATAEASQRPRSRLMVTSPWKDFGKPKRQERRRPSRIFPNSTAPAGAINRRDR